jgi:hypothetical protein
LYDENLKIIGAIYSRGFEKVAILEISKKMYNQEYVSDDCKKANFVKIKYNNKECVVFGNEIFEINEKQHFLFQNPNGDKMSIFPVTNFEMGAADGDGLTGCDDYSVLIINNITKNTFHPIKGSNNRNVTLLHDDGSDEEIYRILVEKDTIVIGVKAFYQEGGSVYKLKTTFKNNFSEASISDKQSFDESELEKLKQIK